MSQSDNEPRGEPRSYPKNALAAIPLILAAAAISSDAEARGTQWSATRRADDSVREDVSKGEVAGSGETVRAKPRRCKAGIEMDTPNTPETFFPDTPTSDRPKLDRVPMCEVSRGPQKGFLLRPKKEETFHVTGPYTGRIYIYPVRGKENINISYQVNDAVFSRDLEPPGSSRYFSYGRNRFSARPIVVENVRIPAGTHTLRVKVSEYAVLDFDLRETAEGAKQDFEPRIANRPKVFDARLRVWQMADGSFHAMINPDTNPLVSDLGKPEVRLVPGREDVLDVVIKSTRQESEVPLRYVSRVGVKDIGFDASLLARFNLERPLARGSAGGNAPDEIRMDIISMVQTSASRERDAFLYHVLPDGPEFPPREILDEYGYLDCHAAWASPPPINPEGVARYIRESVLIHCEASRASDRAPGIVYEGRVPFDPKSRTDGGCFLAIGEVIGEKYTEVSRDKNDQIILDSHGRAVERSILPRNFDRTAAASGKSDHWKGRIPEPCVKFDEKDRGVGTKLEIWRARLRRIPSRVSSRR